MGWDMSVQYTANNQDNTISAGVVGQYGLSELNDTAGMRPQYGTSLKTTAPPPPPLVTTII